MTAAARPAAQLAAPQVTAAEYTSFQQAYDFYNARLFGGTLPQVLMTLQRHPKARGYFAAERFAGRAAADSYTHELALNPDTFDDQEDREILSTLVHEMCHVWQQTHGTPPRRCYHDREFARKMRECGLICSTTAAPGGKETGAQMAHYIDPAGAFERVTRELLQSGLRLNWQSNSAWGKGDAKKKAASKTKYTCPDCEQNCWAKPDARLICGTCYEDDEQIVWMLEAV